jgi:hypothetical protein
MTSNSVALESHSPNKASETICRPISKCRICGSDDLRLVIDLGKQAIASIFVDNEVPALLRERYPLEVVRCSGQQGCGLVQLKHSITPSVLYDNYGYRSGTNESMRANLRTISKAAAELVDLKRGDLVVDIGCNDGTLLESYAVAGIDRLGFDPAPNVAAAAREKGLDKRDSMSSTISFRQHPFKQSSAIAKPASSQASPCFTTWRIRAPSFGT